MAQTVRIIKSTKSAMQSGHAYRSQWSMEFEPDTPTKPDRLIGWSSNSQTDRQIKLHFDQLQDALDYAKEHGLQAVISDAAPQQFQPKSYADNFRSDRIRGR